MEDLEQNETNSSAIVSTLVVEAPASETMTSVIDVRKTMKIPRYADKFGIMTQVIKLKAGESYSIGRSKNNNMVLLSSDISRHHAVFSASRTGLALSDLSSLNGTYLNGQPISSPVDLKSGDRILIGRVTIEVTVHNNQNLNIEMQEQKQEQSCEPHKINYFKITLLVGNIKSYSALSRELPSTDVTSMLDLWSSEITEIILYNDGLIDRFIGDCVVAFWISEHEDSSNESIKAILASSQIMETTKNLGISGKWAHNNTHPLTCRIALNTGKAISNTPSYTKIQNQGIDFTIIDDAINATINLEKLASSKGIPIVFNEDIAKHLDDHIAVVKIDSVSWQGTKNKKVDIFTLA